MIFIGTPNHFVRFSNKTVIRLTGRKGFYFDENGRYETENDLICRVLKQHFEVEEHIEPVIEEEINITDDKPELTEEEIRSLAKEKGIDHYWNAKIENLKEKLEGVI